VSRYSGRAVQPRIAPGGALTRVCPVCGAQIGWKCFRLRSWVGPVPLIGFFTERQASTHVARRKAETDTDVRNTLRENQAGAAPVTFVDSHRHAIVTGDLRRRVLMLIDVKLTQNRKGPARQFVHNPKRTYAEVEAYADKLETMPDAER
jgi:hypothetical protein